MSEEDALYALPLGEFTAARKALAKRLRQAGERDRAAAVDRLTKPTLAAWTLNQLVRHQRPVVDAVLAAIDRQRDLQLGAIRGGLDAEALAAAKAAERAAVAALADRAREVLVSGGQAASKANLDRLGRALRAVALDRAQRERLEAGRLVDEEAEGGLEAIAAQIDPALLLAALEANDGNRRPKKPAVDSFLARSARGVRRPRAAAPSPPSVDPAELARAQARVAALRAEIDEIERAAREGTERVTRLEGELEAARGEVRTARKRLRETRERLDDAEKRLRRLSS